MDFLFCCWCRHSFRFYLILLLLLLTLFFCGRIGELDRLRVTPADWTNIGSEVWRSVRTKSINNFKKCSSNKIGKFNWYLNLVPLLAFNIGDNMTYPKLSVLYVFLFQFYKNLLFNEFDALKYFSHFTASFILQYFCMVDFRCCALIVKHLLIFNCFFKRFFGWWCSF